MWEEKQNLQLHKIPRNKKLSFEDDFSAGGPRAVYDIEPNLRLFARMSTTAPGCLPVGIPSCRWHRIQVARIDGD